MENKTATIASISSVLIAFAGLGFGLFTWYSDKGSEAHEKQAQYKKETSLLIQSIKEQHERELQQHKNAFNEYVLKNQREMYEIRQELLLASQQTLNLKRQNEYLHSQFKLSDEAMYKKVVRELKEK